MGECGGTNSEVDFTRSGTIKKTAAPRRAGTRKRRFSRLTCAKRPETKRLAVMIDGLQRGDRCGEMRYTAGKEQKTG
jgi:hypothetical protein